MKLKHALHHLWLWKKEQIIYSSIFSIVGSLIYHFSPVQDPLMSVVIIIITIATAFSLFTKDHFSWKYYQSLPLGKEELYHFIILSQLIIYLPLLIWFLCFPDVPSQFFSEIPSFDFRFIIGGLILYVLGSFYIGIMTFYNLYELLRAPFAKKTSNISHL